MAEHERTSQKKQDGINQNHRLRQQNSVPQFERFHASEQGILSIGETPFWPQVDKHAVLLAMASSEGGRANLVLQLQQTYGNRYAHQLLQSTKVPAKPVSSVQHQNIPEEEIQKQPVEHQPAAVSEEVETLINNVRGRGQPIPYIIREPMEQALGTDFSDLRRDKTDSLLASAAPPPTNVVLGEEEEVGSEAAEGMLPGLDTEAALLQAGEMKESDEVGSTLESDVLPTAFIDGGSRGEGRVWWADRMLGSNVLPTAFVNSGSTGSDTVWWVGGGATGARGNQGVGSFQEKVDPVYESEPASEGGKYMAWIRDGTGKVKVERSYVSVKTGANGNDWYITARANTRIETHEKGHVNKSKELYESHVKPVEDKVPEVRGKVNAVEAGNSAAQAVQSLKDAVKWDDGIKNFNQKDKDVNKPGGTWDTQEQATADWYYDYGPRSVGNKNYTHYVDQTPGPSSGS